MSHADEYIQKCGVNVEGELIRTKHSSYEEGEWGNAWDWRRQEKPLGQNISSGRQQRSLRGSCESVQRGDLWGTFHATGACDPGRNTAGLLGGKACPWRPWRRRHIRGHWMGKRNASSYVGTEVVELHSYPRNVNKKTYLVCLGNSMPTTSHVMTSAYMSLQSKANTTVVLYKKRMSYKCGCEGEGWSQQ